MFLKLAIISHVEKKIAILFPNSKWNCQENLGVIKLGG